MKFFKLEMTGLIITKKHCYDRHIKKQGVSTMRKHFRLIVVLVVLSLVGGGFLHTINSSASVTANDAQDKTYEDRTHNKQYKHHQHRYAKKYASKKYNRWHRHHTYKYWNKQSNKYKQEENHQSNENNQEDKDTNQPHNQQNGQQNNEQNRPVENQNPTEKETSDQGNVSEFEKRVIELTNKERAAYGLKPLQADYELGRVSKEKSRDMLNYQYFDHNSPIYGSPFDMMDAYQVNYRTAGENIAKGQVSPEEVVNAWMNSEGHRANILNGSFTHIGVGFIDNGNIWTQQFIGR